MAFGKDFGNQNQMISGSRTIAAQTNDLVMDWGYTGTAPATKRLDHKWRGSAAANVVHFDASADTLTLTGITLAAGAQTLTGATTVGTGGTISFSGTGYISHLGSVRNRVELFDDFLGDLIGDEWNVQVDTGGTVNCGTAVVGGAVTLTTDGTDDDTAMVAHELNWKANQGGLVFETRVKVDVVTTLGFFAGLTDAKVETSPNLPMGRATVTTAATATDAVGFVFDTDSTADVLFGSGVKAGTIIADQGASAALVAATWVTLRVEVSAAGAGSWYVDGTQIGATTANAVTATVALTPYVGIANRGAFAHVLNCDYIYVAALRS